MKMLKTGPFVLFGVLGLSGVAGCAVDEQADIAVAEDELSASPVQVLIRDAFPLAETTPGLTRPAEGDLPAAKQLVLNGYTFSVDSASVAKSHLIQLIADSAHPEVELAKGVRFGFRVYEVQKLPKVGEMLTMTRAPLLRVKAPVSSEDISGGLSYETDIDEDFFPDHAGNYVLVVENLKKGKRAEAPYELEVNFPRP